jgi:hypothetical protein
MFQKHKDASPKIIHFFLAICELLAFNFWSSYRQYLDSKTLASKKKKLEILRKNVIQIVTRIDLGPFASQVQVQAYNWWTSGAGGARRDLYSTARIKEDGEFNYECID